MDNKEWIGKRFNSKFTKTAATIIDINTSEVAINLGFSWNSKMSIKDFINAFDVDEKTVRMLNAQDVYTKPYHNNAKEETLGDKTGSFSNADNTLKIGQEFDRIVDVMNNVFGWNYKQCYKGYYRLNDYVSAWFPKIAILDSGVPEPGDKWYGWCNTISDDGEFIYMNNYEDPGRLLMENNVEPHITFIKFPKGRYQYAGVYQREKLDPKKGWIFRRIAKNINLSDYYYH